MKPSNASAPRLDDTPTTAQPAVVINVGQSAQAAPVDPNSPEGRGAGKLAPPPATVPALHTGSTPAVSGAERQDGIRLRD